MIGGIFSSIKCENSDPYFAEMIGKVRVNTYKIRKINIVEMYNITQCRIYILSHTFTIIVVYRKIDTIFMYNITQ